MYQKIPDIPYIMTFRECQTVLKVGKNTLLNMIHDGELHAFRIGNRWKIKREDLIEFMNQR